MASNKQVARNSLWNDFFDDDWFIAPFRFPSNLSQQVQQWTPKCDIAENKDSFSVHAELPGIKKEDIQIHFDQESHVLSIKGESKSEKKEDHQKYHKIERKYGKFERSFSLPDNADGDKIAATMQDGLLNISIPKFVKEEKKQTKKIEII